MQTERLNASEGRYVGFSRWWLCFKGPEEKEYIADLNNQRALGILDPLLFGILAISALACVFPMIKQGQSDMLPLIVLNGLFSGLVTILFRRPQSASLVRSLRIPLHIFSHISNHIQLYRMLGIRKMISCANGRPNTTLLFVNWTFQALYPTVAAIPLVYAAPVHACFALSMLFRTAIMCENGRAVCPRAEDHHRFLTASFGVVSSIMPVPLTNIDSENKDPVKACMAVLSFIPIAVLCVLFYVITYQMEARVRAQYATRKHYFRDAAEFMHCRLTTGHAIFWVVFPLIVIWRFIEFYFLREGAAVLQTSLAAVHEWSSSPLKWSPFKA